MSPSVVERAPARCVEHAQRNADLRLRTSAGPLRTRVWWPDTQEPGTAVGLLLFFADARDGRDTSEAWLRELSSRAGLVIVSVPCAPIPDAVIREGVRDATTALGWAADHARELEADPGRLIVGGTGIGAAVAAAVAVDSAAARWPGIARQLLIGLDLQGCVPLTLAAAPAGAAPATIVTFGHGGEGRWYASRLRQASVDVEELHYDAPAGDDRLVRDLARSLRFPATSRLAPGIS
jgi:acetyl esterase/lipase